MRTVTWLAALALAAAACAADGRYWLTLEKAPPEGAARTLALDCMQDAFRLAGGDASAVKMESDKLRGKVTPGDASYNLDCVVAKTVVTGKHNGTVGGKAVNGLVRGEVAPSRGLAAPSATAPFAGVLGEYYATRECGELLWTRLDDRVGFTDWEGLRETGRRERALSARWTGFLHVSTSGVHVLEHRSDGLLTVCIDGKTVIRYQKANPAGDTTEVSLERGEYPVEIEYRHAGPEARLELSWRPPQGKSRPLAGGDLLLRLSPGMPPQIAEMFDLDQPVERHRVPGLRGQYFQGVDHRAFRGAGVGGDLLHQQRDRYLSMRGTYPVAARDMSVRWTGVFMAQRAGEYSFDLTRVCDAVRIWVGGRELVQDKGMARAKLGEGLHPLRIEHVYVQDKGWIDVTWTGPGQSAPAVLGGRHVWTRPWDDMRDPQVMVIYAFYGHSQVDGGAAGKLEHGNRVWLFDAKENRWRRAGENGSGPIEPFLDALAARHPGVWFGGLKMVQYGSDLRMNMSKGTRAYQSLIERIRLALGHPATRLGGVACIIGYGDLDRKPSEKQFAEEYIALIDSIRKDLAEPDLPFVVSQIEPLLDRDRRPGWQPIHNAIVSLPGLCKQIAVAPANDLFRDAIHYTGPGYRRWGNEAAAEVLKQSLLDPILARSRGEDGERLAARVVVRPPASQVLAVVEARIARASAARTPAQLAPYRDGLVATQYDVLRVIQGTLDDRRIVVLDFSVRDGKPMPAASRKVGEELRLVLASWEAQESLATLPRDDSLDDLASPEFFALETHRPQGSSPMGEQER